MGVCTGTGGAAATETGMERDGETCNTQDRQADRQAGIIGDGGDDRWAPRTPKKQRHGMAGRLCP